MTSSCDLPDPGYENPAEGAISEAQPKRIEVALPKGVTINPSQAEGLATCSEAQYEAERYDSQPGEGCPEASKIGTVESATPLIEGALSGSLYVATPYENPTAQPDRPLRDRRARAIAASSSNSPWR